MRKTAFVTFALVLLLSSHAEASASMLRENLAVITANLAENASIHIVSLEKGDVLFSKNGEKPLNPASTTKLVTAAAAFQYLGPDYKFHTPFYLTQERDLYIEGRGDPSIVIEELRTIAADLKKRGVRNIRNIVVDDSYFKDYRSPGLDGEADIYTGALSLNFNRVLVEARGGTGLGQPAEVKVLAGDTPIEIENRVKTVRKRGGAAVGLDWPKDGSDRLIITGRVPAGGKKRVFEAPIPFPAFYFALSLKTVFTEAGGRMTGTIQKGTRPNEATFILDHLSKPLSEIVKDMNKFSNNFMAEQIVKFLGASFEGGPGSTEKGTQVLKKYLASLGTTRVQFSLINGSGLTRENRLSAASLTRVIQDMHKNKKIWPYFKDSLSVAGVDGTLKGRFRNGPLYGRILAKTGYIAGARTLAGIVPADNGENLAFAILLNGGGPRNAEMKTQEMIAHELASFRR